MDLPGRSHSLNDRPGLSPLERGDSIVTGDVTGISRIYQNPLTSGNAQAHYGDRIMHGDSHVHYHREALHLVIRARLTLTEPSHEATRPSSPRKRINTLRWLRDPQFVGREDTLASIKEVLEVYGCVALTEAGGVGFVVPEVRIHPTS